MRIFVCEYVSGGGFAGAALPQGLLHEGEIMLRALVRDLAAIRGIDLLVARDARLLSSSLPGTPVPVPAGEDRWQVWADAIAAADAVWPIAPETDGLLLRLSNLAIASGRALLGCQPEAIRLCGSKLDTATRLTSHGIPVVPTQRLTPDTVKSLPDAVAGWVVKPDDGAGAEDTFRIESRPAFAAFQATVAADQTWVVQPFLPGAAVSLSLLCRDGEAWLVSCNHQHITIEAGRFRYQGWTVGGGEAGRSQYEPIARAIARAVPGLFGYVGIDLIDTVDGPVVLEINPRLTTPYACLRDATASNPAEHVLALANAGRPPLLRAAWPQMLRLEA